MKPLLILFVHGLGATSESTWGEFSRLIDQDDKLGPVTDVRFFGFKTAKTRWSFLPSARKQKVMDLAKGLRTEIDERYGDYQKIVLVGHSMGGLVIRQYLVSEVRNRSPLRVNKAVLYAVPNAGSEIAAVANLFSVTHAQLTDLTPDSPFLTSLNDDWRDFNLDSYVDVTHVVAALDEAVRQQSAVGLWGRARVKVVTDKSHSGLVSVTDKTDLAFLILRKTVLDYARHDRSLPFEARRSDGEAQSPILRATPAWNQLPPTPAVVMTMPSEPPTSLTNQLSTLLAGRSPAEVLASAEPKARLDELFDVISESDELAPAFFRVERNLPLAPYDTEYVNSREGVADTQQELEIQLRKAKGRLLLCGPRGIGKTREIAELARAASDSKWKVLVARADGDPRMGPVSEIPATLTDEKLWIVIDNIHTRILTTANQPGPPYVERLLRLLGTLERIAPGSVRVVATTRDEPRFQTAVQLTEAQQVWQTFGVYRLPRITDDRLSYLLTSLAAGARVGLPLDIVDQLIKNSDRKPETVFINVDRARRANKALSAAEWKPTEGESWHLRFVTARAEQAGVDAILQIVHLLIKAGLPARVPYVQWIVAAQDANQTRTAVDLLVGEGLLRLRHGVLTPYSAEQLAELEGHGAVVPLELREHAVAIETAIRQAGGDQAEQINDLIKLALALDRQGDQETAEVIASRAVNLHPANPRARQIRSAIRFSRRDLAGAAKDLDAALDSDDKQEDIRLLRACIRNLSGDHGGALQDLEILIQSGRTDAGVQTERVHALMHSERWSDADTAATAAIASGGATGVLFFIRGIIRVRLNRLQEAEEDFSKSLEMGANLASLPGQIQKLENAFSGDAPSLFVNGPAAGDAMINAMRGWVRLRSGRIAEAEQDLTIAIETNAAGQLSSLGAAMRTSTVPAIANATKKLGEAEVLSEGHLHQLRGAARFNLGKLHDAVADFDEAIARGRVEGEVFYGRGIAHLRLGNAADAARDADLAIAGKKEDAATFSLRGVSRLALKQFADAEADFDRALELDPANGFLYSSRASARLEQRKLESAESDLTTALSYQPDNARASYVRGLIRFDLGQFAHAEDDFTTAENGGYSEGALFTFRGLARLMQNKLVEASEDAEKAINTGAGDWQAYSLRAAIALSEQRHEQAESDLNASIERGRADVWVFANRGRVRYDLQQYPQAEQDFTVAIDLDANDADLFVQRARARLAQNKSVDAEQDFREAAARGRDDAFVHFSLARAYQQQHRHKEAEAEFTFALEREDSQTFRQFRGYTRLLSGATAEAVSDFDCVIAASPSNGLCLYLRALARFTQRRYSDARRDCDAALAISPKDSAALAVRAMVSIRENDFEAADRDCTALEQIAPDSADSIGCRAVLQIARGEFNDALVRLRQVIVTDERWLAELGLAALLGGQVEEAKEAYARVAASSQVLEKQAALDALAFHLDLHLERAALHDIQIAADVIRSLFADAQV